MRGSSAAEIQRVVSQTLMRALNSRQYSQLAMFLEILARANGNENVVERIHRVKAGCFIDFESFCLLYLKSFMMPSNRSIRFMGTGQKFTWTQIRLMATEQFVIPLGIITIDLLGSLGETQTASLKSVVESMQHFPIETRPAVEELNVVFDNVIKDEDEPAGLKDEDDEDEKLA